jgi:glycosyltransferase involved in cell wall biosynthesis
MCTQLELSELYASADLLLFPSLTETFGNVTLEALACGTPVLAFDCAAASELIQDAKNGWLVQGEDPQRYVLKALSIAQSNKVLGEVRAYAHQSVQHMDWKVIATQMETIFRISVEENPSA